MEGFKMKIHFHNLTSYESEFYFEICIRKWSRCAPETWRCSPQPALESEVGAEHLSGEAVEMFTGASLGDY